MAEKDRPRKTFSNTQDYEYLSNTGKSMCRICLEDDTRLLINPCFCKGSTKYVHEACIKDWIDIKFANIKEATCEICKMPMALKIKYKMRCNEPLHAKDEPTKYLKQFLSILLSIILGISGFFLAILAIVTDYFNLYAKIFVIIFGIIVGVLFGILAVVLIKPNIRIDLEYTVCSRSNFDSRIDTQG
ncbi:hypothetical protein SteCoe_4875 [Stentor coeruleus]|uniref:RING-CH-type domain-containing protein n=1 Tax=Stentor coeruleus TaxID=5963 RepID=A0A1R2CTI4_9CILI|nr:hypothetical protein SteCoe_4875 [Stentor coeruleus]